LKAQNESESCESVLNLNEYHARRVSSVGRPALARGAPTMQPTSHPRRHDRLAALGQLLRFALTPAIDLQSTE